MTIRFRNSNFALREAEVHVGGVVSVVLSSVSIVRTSVSSVLMNVRIVRISVGILRIEVTGVWTNVSSV